MLNVAIPSGHSRSNLHTERQSKMDNSTIQSYSQIFDLKKPSHGDMVQRIRYDTQSVTPPRKESSQMN